MNNQIVASKLSFIGDIMEKIVSKNNPAVKEAKKLVVSASERKKQNLFVLEGARLCFDILNSDFEIETLFVGESARKKYPDKTELLKERSNRSYEISDEVAKKLSDTANAQGIFAVCQMRCGSVPDSRKKYIALDNIQDPSNLGAVIRTAEALGIDGVIVSGGCDVFNPKAIRASMGSVLRLNVFCTDDLCKLLGSLKNKGVKVYSSVPSADAQSIINADFSGGCVCVVGNEANGVSEEVKALSQGLVTVPMKGRAESLNAAAAAAIIMWEMLR